MQFPTMLIGVDVDSKHCYLNRIDIGRLERMLVILCHKLGKRRKTHFVNEERTHVRMIESDVCMLELD